jgi:hemerythrin-like domain-containing protein
LHDAIRGDLALLRRVAAAVATGGEGATPALRDLAVRRPGWSLTRFCTTFCGFVHEHHSVEDAVVFPMVLEHGGGNGLRDVVAKLTEDHRVVAGLLDEVDAALAGPPGDPAARSAAVAAVERLAERLEEHLRYEEASLADALDAVSRAVPEEHVPAPPRRG